MEPSAAKGKPQGRFLVSTALDAKDELEEVGGFSRRGSTRLFISMAGCFGEQSCK